jgi:hypothetical protein
MYTIICGNFEVNECKDKNEVFALVKNYLIRENLLMFTYSDIIVTNGSIIFDDWFNINENTDIELTNKLQEFYIKCKKEKEEENMNKREIEEENIKLKESEEKELYLKLKEKFENKG